MCDLNEGFKLCTCEPEPEKELLLETEADFENFEYVPPDWTWQLKKYFGRSNRKGRAMFPREKINGITPEFVSEELNRRKCFDFDYTPEENHILIFEKGVQYFVLGFQDGKWRHFPDYSPFSYTRPLQWKGKILPHKD